MVTTKILLVAVALALVVSAIPSPHHNRHQPSSLKELHSRPETNTRVRPRHHHQRRRQYETASEEEDDRGTRGPNERRSHRRGGLIGGVLGLHVGGPFGHGLRFTHLGHLSIFNKICNHEKTGIARDIFLEMSRITQAATNLNEVLYLQVRSIYAIVRILNAWIAGFGDIFGIMANYVFRVAYCVQSETPRLAPGVHKKGWGNPDFCRPDYVSKWDTRRYSGSYSNALEVYNFFEIQDYIGKFDILARSYQQEFSIGTRGVIFRSFKLLVDICRRPYSQWSEQDIASVYRITVTIVAAFGGSYNRNRGLSLAEAYVGHFSSVAPILGFDISAHYGTIKTDIRKCDRTSLNNAFSIQTRNRHFRISRKPRYDLSRYRTYAQVCSHKRTRAIFYELGRYRTKISTFQDAIKTTVTLGRGLQHILNSWIPRLGTYYLNSVLAFVRTISCTTNGYYYKWHTKYGWSRPEVCNKDFGKQWNWRAFRGSYSRSSIYRFHRVSSSQKFVERLWSSNKYTHATEKKMLIFVRSTLSLLQKSSFGGEEFGGIIRDLASLYGAVGKAYDGNLGIHMANDVMNTYNDFATKLFQVNWASYTQKVQTSIETCTTHRLGKAIRTKRKEDVIEVVNSDDTNVNGNTGSDDEQTSVDESQDTSTTVTKTTSTTNKQVTEEEDDDDDDDDDNTDSQQSASDNTDDDVNDGDSGDFDSDDIDGGDENYDDSDVDNDRDGETNNGINKADTGSDDSDDSIERKQTTKIERNNSDDVSTDSEDKERDDSLESQQTKSKTTRVQTNGKKKCRSKKRGGNRSGVTQTTDRYEEDSLEEVDTNSQNNRKRRKHKGRDSGYEEEDEVTRTQKRKRTEVEEETTEEEDNEDGSRRGRRPRGKPTRNKKNGRYRPGDDDEDSIDDTRPRKARRESVRIRHNKQHPLSIFNPFSLIFSSQRLSRSFRSISRTRKVASNYNDGFEVIAKLTDALAYFVDNWRKPGLGKLLRKLTMSILRIYGCTTDSPIRKKSQSKGWGDLAVCKKSYGQQWGFEPYRGSYSSISEIYDYYGQDDIYKTLEDSLGDLSGSEKVVGEAILDLAKFSQKTNKNNLDIDGFTNVYGYYITIMTALAKSHNVKLGDYVERALHSYYLPLFKISGVEIDSFRLQWQKRTANCRSARFGNTIQNSNSFLFEDGGAGDSGNDDGDTDTEYDESEDDTAASGTRTSSSGSNNSEENTRTDVHKRNKNRQRKNRRNNDGRTGVTSDTSDDGSDSDTASRSEALAESSSSDGDSTSSSAARAVSESESSSNGRSSTRSVAEAASKSSDSNGRSSSRSRAQASSESADSNGRSSTRNVAEAASKSSDSNGRSSSRSRAQASSESEDSNARSSTRSRAQASSESDSNSGGSSTSNSVATAQSSSNNGASNRDSSASSNSQSSSDRSRSKGNSRSSGNSQSSGGDDNSNSRSDAGSSGGSNEGSGKGVVVSEEDGKGYGGQSSYAGGKSSQSFQKDSSGNVDARRHTEGGSGKSEASGSQAHRKTVVQNGNGQMSQEDWQSQQQAGSANERHQSDDQLQQSADGSFTRTKQESAQSNSNQQKQNAGASQTAFYGSDGSMSQQQSSFSNSQSSTNNAYSYKKQTVSKS